MNKDSRSWIIVCLLLLAAATGIYIPYAAASEKIGGAGGGSVVGIIMGSAGFGMMLFAMLLGLRKRFRTLRVGRAYFWTQGHIWLGLLSYPIILYHSGFRFGGVYTSVLMWLFTMVVISGIVGLIIQQFMPGQMLRDVQYETIYDQIDHVISMLAEDAGKIVAKVKQAGENEAFDDEVVPAGAAVATMPRANAAAAKALEDFYTVRIKPFLVTKPSVETGALNKQAWGVLFEQIKGRLPRAMYDDVDDLAQIVEERRQLAEQRRMHNLLHGWLLVHVPLSYLLMLLAVVHIWVALRYVWRI